MGLTYFRLIACVVCVAWSLPQATYAKTVALIVGASDYRHLPKLANSVDDSEMVEAVLKLRGFETIKVIDPSLNTFHHAIELFRQESAGAELAVFFFTGHGTQFDGENILLPVDANPKSPEDLLLTSIRLDRVIARLVSQKRVVILDCSRDNPFATRERSSEKGLTVVEPPPDTLIAFSTAPGMIAADKAGAGSVFTETLVRELSRKGNFGEAISNATRRVAVTTKGEQRPFVASDQSIQSFQDQTQNPASPMTGILAEDTDRTREELQRLEETRRLLEGMLTGVREEKRESEGEGVEMATVQPQVIRVPVFFGTSSNRFTRDQTEGGETFHKGIATVSLPRNRKIGTIPRASLWKLEFSNQEGRHAVLREIQLLRDGPFFEKVEATLNDDGQKTTLLFVHGSGVTFESAALRTAQLSIDLNFDGVPMFFSWSATDASAGADASLAAVRDSRHSIAEFVRDLLETQGLEKVFVVAQDLGGEAISPTFPFTLEEAEKWSAEPGRPDLELILTGPTFTRKRFFELAPALEAIGAPVTVYLGPRATPLDWIQEEAEKFGFRRFVAIDASRLVGSAPMSGITKLIQMDPVVEDISELLRGRGPEDRRRIQASEDEKVFQLLP